MNKKEINEIMAHVAALSDKNLKKNITPPLIIV